MSNKTDYQIKQVLKYNRDGSPNKQTTRHNVLIGAFRHLQDNRGYSKRFDLQKLTRKELDRLVHDWKHDGIEHRTIANRLAEFRWLATKLGIADRIPSRNKAFGLQRKGYSDVSRAEPLDRDTLKGLGDRERLIVELRAQFGLRTEEAIKFSAEYATAKSSHYIQLHLKWTKGGRPRTISVTKQEQRELLTNVLDYQRENGDRSLVPGDMKYLTYYRIYNAIREEANIPGHGLRHHWAQQRFMEVSRGLAAPLAGGRKYSELNKEERGRYEKAERTVNRELGHGTGRKDITRTYIGGRC